MMCWKGEQSLALSDNSGDGGPDGGCILRLPTGASDEHAACFGRAHLFLYQSTDRGQVTFQEGNCYITKGRHRPRSSSTFFSLHRMSIFSGARLAGKTVLVTGASAGIGKARFRRPFDQARY